MNNSAPKSIIIVGGGASATLLLAHLSQQLNVDIPVDIYIFDDRGAFNLGNAYQVKDPSFILNVPANHMGAYCDRPDDFYQWMLSFPDLWRNLHDDFKYINYEPDDFVPRMIYGAYLGWISDTSLLLAAQKNIQVHKITAKVTSIFHHKNKLVVNTDAQEFLPADTVILATGNSTPACEPRGPQVFSSPYDHNFVRQDWKKIKDLIIVGSGLSMVDAVQYLAQQNYQGCIQVFSRHGLLPMPHCDAEQSPLVPFLFSNLSSARDIIRCVREYIKNNSSQGIEWQTTLNSLRHAVNPAWLGLPPHERKKLRRIMPWWNVARHRIPKEAHNMLARLQHEKRLIIRRGHVTKITSESNYLCLKIDGIDTRVEGARLVVCSGYTYTFEKTQELCGKLLDKIPPAINLQDFKLSPHYSLYAIGPALGNLLFETTAIREIRLQSERIAAHLSYELHASGEKASVKTLSSL